MKRRISVKGIMIALIVTLLFMGMGSQAAVSLHVSPGIGAGIVLVLVLAGIVLGRNANMSGVTAMGIQVEIWENHIEGNLFKGNEFLQASVDASQYTLAGKVVHIPQAGATPNVVKNRAFTGAPITVTQRTDTDITYALDEYTSDPIQIPNADKVELSYNKRESVLMEHEMTLKQVIADVMLTLWAPNTAGSILRTTGDVTDATLDVATGSRRALRVKDFLTAQKVLNKQNFAMEGRYALLSADMHAQLIEDMSQTQYRDFSAAMDEKTGIIGKLYGFNIYQRSSVLSYTNDAVPVVNAYGGAGNADDNDTALFWQMTAVERAVGAVKFFQSENNPVYFGDVYSMLVRMGGRKRRADSKGILAMVQAAGGGN